MKKDSGMSSEKSVAKLFGSGILASLPEAADILEL